MSEKLSERQIAISWPDLGITVTADLDDRNPALADALWESLPYQSLQGHALIAGEHLYHVAPIPTLLHTPHATRIPDRREAPDGTVFCSGLQHLGIKYGTLTEPMPATPSAGSVKQTCPPCGKPGRRSGTPSTPPRSRSSPKSAAQADRVATASRCSAPPTRTPPN